MQRWCCIICSRTEPATTHLKLLHKHALQAPLQKRPFCRHVYAAAQPLPNPVGDGIHHQLEVLQATHVCCRCLAMSSPGKARSHTCMPFLSHNICSCRSRAQQNHHWPASDVLAGLPQRSTVNFGYPKGFWTITVRQPGSRSVTKCVGQGSASVTISAIMSS